MNKKKHPLAGKKVKLKLAGEKGKNDPQGIDGKMMIIEDWAENVFRGSWMIQQGNPTAMFYGIRAGFANLPTDDDVVYGKVDGLAYLVHNSEI